MAGRSALCLRRLGYVPADPFDLTPAQIADIGIGVDLPPPRRVRLSSPLPSAESGPPSEEDERAILARTPVSVPEHRGQPVLKPEPREIPVDDVVQLAPDGPDLAPPIAWMDTYDAIEPSAPASAKDEVHCEDSFDSDPLGDDIAKHERDGPEFKRWKAEVQAQTVRTVMLRGKPVEVLVPVLERHHAYRKQGTGSGRKPTRDCNAEALIEKQRRAYIENHGVPYESFAEIGNGGIAKPSIYPAYDVRTLLSAFVPDRLISTQLAALMRANGALCLFVHSELTPPRRPLLGHGSNVFGVLPKSKPSDEDKAALTAVRSRLPIDIEVTRINNDTHYPMLSPVRGFELYVDTPAGRSLAAVPEPVNTDFVVTADGRVLGPVHCSVILGQTMPKTPNTVSLKEPMIRLYHNRVLDAFFPEPYGPPVRLAVDELHAVAAPFKKLLTSANVMAVVRTVAYAVRRGVYALKHWRGPPMRQRLTDTEEMECQALFDYNACETTRGCLRRSDPLKIGTAMHDFVNHTAYLQIGGMAASSPISISPLGLPLKAPVRQSAKLVKSDSIPQIFNGRGERIYRYPPAETQQDIDERAKQGTAEDQRSITTEQRIALGRRALDEKRLTKAQKRKFMPLYTELLRTKSQSNLQRWELINLLKDAGVLGNQDKVSQGSIRRTGLHYAVHRNQWYWSEVFRAVTLGENPCAIVYQRDVRDVSRRYRIEFREWVDEPVEPKRLKLTIDRPGKPEFVLRSHEPAGWGKSSLNAEQKNVVILAVYWCMMIAVKRRVKAQLRADWYYKNVEESCKTLDLQIEELRCKIRGLGGLSQPFIARLCR